MKTVKDPEGFPDWESSSVKKFVGLSAYEQVLTGRLSQFDGHAERLAEVLLRLRDPKSLAARKERLIASWKSRAPTPWSSQSHLLWLISLEQISALERARKVAHKYGVSHAVEGAVRSKCVRNKNGDAIPPQGWQRVFATHEELEEERATLSGFDVGCAFVTRTSDVSLLEGKAPISQTRSVCVSGCVMEECTDSCTDAAHVKWAEFCAKQTKTWQLAYAAGGWHAWKQAQAIKATAQTAESPKKELAATPRTAAQKQATKAYFLERVALARKARECRAMHKVLMARVNGQAPSVPLHEAQQKAFGAFYGELKPTLNGLPVSQQWKSLRTGTLILSHAQKAFPAEAGLLARKFCASTWKEYISSSDVAAAALRKYAVKLSPAQQKVAAECSSVADYKAKRDAAKISRDEFGRRKFLLKWVKPEAVEDLMAKYEKKSFKALLEDDTVLAAQFAKVKLGWSQQTKELYGWCDSWAEYQKARRSSAPVKRLKGGATPLEKAAVFSKVGDVRAVKIKPAPASAGGSKPAALRQVVQRVKPLPKATVGRKPAKKLELQVCPAPRVEVYPLSFAAASGGSPAPLSPRPPENPPSQLTPEAKFGVQAQNSWLR